MQNEEHYELIYWARKSEKKKNRREEKELWANWNIICMKCSKSIRNTCIQIAKNINISENRHSLISLKPFGDAYFNIKISHEVH